MNFDLTSHSRFHHAARLALLLLSLCSVPIQAQYFPPPDSRGGWRERTGAWEIRWRNGVDVARLDEAFHYIQGTSKHGGLLVVRDGWLIYERYFGRAHREAAPNLASIGKSVTSLAVGILLDERPDLFPDGLDQKVFTPTYFPPEAFPLSDPRKAEIRLGQLLAMSAGIRGNNPGYVKGKPVTLAPAGPDGWQAVVDEMALGKMDGPLNTITLWCRPGEGYSYATSSIHLASILLRHVTGKELQQYVDERIARPLGWERWGWGYRRPEIRHTPGGGGIALRPTDVMRFGHLLLLDGRWQGGRNQRNATAVRQVVPAAYVRHARRRSPYNPHFPYSLQFDVNDGGDYEGVPRDAFWKQGSGGHCLYVVPSLRLVIFKMGGRDDQYDPRNTGLPPVPESVFTYDGSRENWKPVANLTDPHLETLRLVLASIAK